MGMPPVQKAALAMLPKLAPTHLPQVGAASPGQEIWGCILRACLARLTFCYVSS